MRSRLAILAVAVGSGLLGWSTVGVTAVAGTLSQAPAGTTELHQHEQQPDGAHRLWHHGDRDDV